LLSLSLIIFVLVFGARTYLNDKEARANKTPEVHFFDVGQGDASLIELNGNQQVLVDGGPDKSILTHLGREMPANDRFIEYIVLSHPHADHLAGLNYVLDRYDVGQIIMSDYVNKSAEFNYFLQAVAEKKIKIISVSRGDLINLEVGRILFFWPDREHSNVDDLNDLSLIFKFEVLGASFLYTGDASYQVEELSLAGTKEVDVLKVSHHGSKTGTSQKLFEALSPSYSVISVGDNKYGHPHKEVIIILAESSYFRTDIQGTVTFIVTIDGVTLKS
jgi:competence protein ComEC